MRNIIFHLKKLLRMLECFKLTVVYYTQFIRNLIVNSLKGNFVQQRVYFKSTSSTKVYGNAICSVQFCLPCENLRIKFAICFVVDRHV